MCVYVSVVWCVCRCVLWVWVCWCRWWTLVVCVGERVNMGFGGSDKSSPSKIAYMTGQLFPRPCIFEADASISLPAASAKSSIVVVSPIPRYSTSPA